MNRPALPGLNLHRFGGAQRNRSDLLCLWRWMIVLGSVQMSTLYLHRIGLGVR